MPQPCQRVVLFLAVTLTTFSEVSEYFFYLLVVSSSLKLIIV